MGIIVKDRGPVAGSAAELLRKYSNISNAVLIVDPALPREGYSIRQEGDISMIAGGSPSGLVYGAGRMIRDPLWRGVSAPEKAIRGIYFATHFDNWYDHASCEELEEYLEHLAIWGCNAVRVWFDMHQYRGIKDPAAQKKIERLRHIFRKAGDLGMMCCLIGLANEAYADSPEELRADWTGGHDNYRYNLAGHYHRELCPSKPGAMDLLMKWRGELLDEFAGCNISIVSMNPYDQGGCTCPECAPFGANGFLKILPHFAEEVHKRFPKAQVMVDTWRFDVFTDGEWDGFTKKIEEIRKYSRLLLVPADQTDQLARLPEDVSGAVFMEISMGHNLPWGGFGANPRPSIVNDLRERLQSRKIIGSFPYSEGIYEDLNKIMILGMEWDTSVTAEEMIRAYASFYFGPLYAEDILKAVMLLEEDFGHDAVILQEGKKIDAYSIEHTDPAKPWKIEYSAGNPVPEKAEECFRIMEKIRLTLPEKISDSLRWRLLYLRSRIDFLLSVRSDREELEKIFLELYDLYHCTPDTLPCLIPPSAEKWGRAVREHRSGMV